MTPILTAAQMREADRRAIEELGIPGLVLMENAARGACDVLAELLNGLDGRSIAVICGKGNNGGDGIALARHALIAGARVRCALLAAPGELSPDAAAQHAMLAAYAPEVITPWQEFAGGHECYDAVVDAMLGTGAGGALTGAYAEAVAWCNAHDAVRLALDIPTGVDADTGTSAGAAFDADATATMAALKPGLLLCDGAERSGDLFVVHIGAPALLYEHSGMELLDTERAAVGMPELHGGRHKYDRGFVLVAAGSRGMTGAAVMAAEAALRSGAGLTTLALPESTLGEFPQRILPEIMTLPLPSDQAGAFARNAFAGLDISRYTAILVGPGIARGDDTAAAIRDFVAAVNVPLVLDAGGLNAFAGSGDQLRALNAPVVITPHHGEMCRLTGTERQKITADPVGIARRSAAAWNCVVVLKGAPTVIAAPDGRVWINGAGNPGMASGGMGDVLAGVITAMIAQTPDVLEATLAAVYLHSHAADLAADAGSMHALTASDVIAGIPAAYRSLLPA